MSEARGAVIDDRSRAALAEHGIEVERLVTGPVISPSASSQGIAGGQHVNSGWQGGIASAYMGVRPPIEEGAQ
eukprot:11588268-Alexandrium_andersonii.AAC.1